MRVLPLYCAFWGNRCVHRPYMFNMNVHSKKREILTDWNSLSVGGMLYSAQQIGI